MPNPAGEVGKGPLFRPENRQSKNRYRIIALPAATLSEADITGLAPGERVFVGVIRFPEKNFFQAAYLGKDSEKLFQLRDHVDDPEFLFAAGPVMFLAISRDAEGKLQLLGYGAGSKPIMKTGFRGVENDIPLPKSVEELPTLEKKETLDGEVVRPHDKNGKRIEHFLEFDIQRREPLLIRVRLFGKYEARF